MRYRLRTLLIAVAVLPPVLAPLGVWGWREYVAWRNTRLAAPSSETGYLGAKLDGEPALDRGIRVISVRLGTPAEAGGLMVGDVITSLNNCPCRDWNSFDRVMDRTALGMRLPIVVIRDGKKKTLVVKLGQLPRR